MKIGILGPAHPYRGGIAAFTERMAQALISEGHEVVIYTYTLQYPDFMFPGKTQFTDKAPPAGLTILRRINSVNPLSWRKAALKIIEDNNEVLIPMFWMPIMGLSQAKILMQVKKKIPHAKVLSVVHNLIPHESRVGDHSLTKQFTSVVDGYMVLTESVLHDVRKYSNKPALVSPHPIYDSFGDIEDQEEARARLRLEREVPYLLFFGLIREYKGLDLLLEALADNRLEELGVRLIIAGEYYSKKDKYAQLIEAHSLSSRIVDVDQFIPDDQVAHYFNAADLVVQPYKSATQSGVTQIAYHFDKPMVVTDVGGLREMCPDGKVGYVVEPNAQAIADGIYRFLTSSDKEAMTNGIREEKAKYSWETFVENLFTLESQVES